MLAMADPKALEGLIDELRLSLHRVTRVAEQLHADEPIPIGMRAVLEYLLLNSESTVPAIANLLTSRSGTISLCFAPTTMWL